MDWFGMLSAFIGAFLGVVTALLIAARISKQPDTMVVSRETLERVEEAKAKYGLPFWEDDGLDPQDIDSHDADLSIDPEDSDD